MSKLFVAEYSMHFLGSGNKTKVMAALVSLGVPVSPRAPWFEKTERVEALIEAKDMREAQHQAYLSLGWLTTESTTLKVRSAKGAQAFDPGCKLRCLPTQVTLYWLVGKGTMAIDVSARHDLFPNMGKNSISWRKMTE